MEAGVAQDWRWGRFWRTTAVFALVGPLVGTAVVLLLLLLPTLGAIAPADDCGTCRSAAAIGLIAVVVGALIALVMAPLAIAPAMATGLIAAWMRERRSPRLAYVPACAVLGAACSWVAYALAMLVMSGGDPGQGDDAFATLASTLAATGGGAAGLACALITLWRWPVSTPESPTP